MECYKCNTSDESGMDPQREFKKPIRKCPICYKHFCEDCGSNRGGRWFCSVQCGDYFFFGDVDD
jgi:hypothetical protein